MTREPTGAFVPKTTVAICPECGTSREITSLTGVTSKPCDACVEKDDNRPTTWKPTQRGRRRVAAPEDVDLTPPKRTEQREWWND